VLHVVGNALRQPAAGEGVFVLPVILSLFLILHGLVHVLCAGHSLRFFELRPGMLWPDGSWLFVRLLGTDATRSLAAALLAAAALAFIAGGLGLMFRQEGWRPTALGAAVFSAALFLLLWNGRLQTLDEQGAVGVLIDLALLLAILTMKWPG
jgi:hypothetical protein